MIYIEKLIALAPLLSFRWNSLRSGFLGRNISYMRQAIGFVIVLWALFHWFGQSMSKLDQAASAGFQTLEKAAQVAEARLSE